MSLRAIAPQPRLAYRTLERRATVLLTLALLALAAVAWWVTVDRALGMSDMEGMADGAVGSGPAMGLTAVGGGVGAVEAAVFLGMWVTMMVAMMFPTIAPVVLLHRAAMRRAGVGWGRSVAFGAGYLLVWSASGLVPLAVLVVVRGPAAEAAVLSYAAGLVLVGAGLYQFTAWKQACLRACVSPMTFLATHDFGHGWRGSVRAGAGHGLFCLGCCWALMAVLFVLGLMNLVWMAAITLVFVAEKHLRTGVRLSRVVGAGVVLLGVLVLLDRGLLTTLAA